jgi:flagellar assembly protein FliH
VVVVTAMSSSPEERAPVLRGDLASGAPAASFGVDLRRGIPADSAPVERAKEAARTAGYAEGWAQGQRAAALATQAAQDQAAAAEQAYDARRAAALAQGVAAIGRAAAGLEGKLQPTLAQLQELIVTHALDLAEAVIGRELTDPDGRGTDAVRRAIAAAPEQGEITVRLHPEDYRNIMGSAADADYQYHGRPVHLRPDPALLPGDAVAETGSTTVDASIAAAMKRAREVLGQ